MASETGNHGAGESSADRDPSRTVITVLEPEDEYPHDPDEAANYNESMYFGSAQNAI